MESFWKKKSGLKQEDKLRDKPGYEHLNDPLHVLVEAEFPADIVDARLNQAVAILEDLLKPVVCTLTFCLSLLSSNFILYLASPLVLPVSLSH